MFDPTSSFPGTRQRTPRTWGTHMLRFYNCHYLMAARRLLISSQLMVFHQAAR